MGVPDNEFVLPNSQMVEPDKIIRVSLEHPVNGATFILVRDGNSTLFKLVQFCKAYAPKVLSNGKLISVRFEQLPNAYWLIAVTDEKLIDFMVELR